MENERGRMREREGEELKNERKGRK